MKSTLLFFLFTNLLTGISSANQEMPLPIKDGEYVFEHKFAEAEQHKIKSIKLNVTIKGRHIIVINNDRFDVFPKGVLEEGTLMWHSSSGQWIIGNNPSDKDEIDVGGCSDGPTVIDLEKQIYWTC